MNAIQHLIDAIGRQTSGRWQIEPPELAQASYADALKHLDDPSNLVVRPQLHRFFADDYALIVADLGSRWQSGRETWLLAQTEVALLRATLAPGRNEDFLLIFVSEAGTNRESEWIALAAEIERNDRVCRKLVWLPPAAEDQTEESLRSFLGRSFLARPWLNRSPEALTALDAAKNPSDILGDWETILDQNLRREPDYLSLVRALIEKESK